MTYLGLVGNLCVQVEEDGSKSLRIEYMGLDDRVRVASILITKPAPASEPAAPPSSPAPTA